jgi:hypothetical protein
MPDTLEQAPPEPTSDRAGFRLAAFAAAMVVVLFAGYGIGRLNDSVERARATPAATGDGHAHDMGVPAGPHDNTGGAPHDNAGGAPQNNTGPAPHDDSGAAPHVHNADGTVTQVSGSGAAAGGVGGLAVTAAGLTLVPETGSLRAGRSEPYRFKISAPGGAPVTTFAVVHDKALHFVVVRRDLTGFQHLHPTMTPDGTWSIDLTLAAPGSYRGIADFTAVVGGRQTPATLGVDLTVAGDYRPVPLPAPVPRATTDGFTISYVGTPQTGVTQPLLMTVAGPDGKPAALEPYLGAFGHLVVLRDGDVGYVHVHPEPEPVDGAVKFWLTAPGPGRYRMFFDFQVAGRVHTAAFTAIVR